MAAYKYQAPRLQSRAFLMAAVAIHSVEARHAAWIRHLAGVLPAATAFDQPLPPHEVNALVASTHFVVGVAAHDLASFAEVHGVMPQTCATLILVLAGATAHLRWPSFCSTASAVGLDNDPGSSFPPPPRPGFGRASPGGAAGDPRRLAMGTGPPRGGRARGSGSPRRRRSRRCPRTDARGHDEHPRAARRRPAGAAAAFGSGCGSPYAAKRDHRLGPTFGARRVGGARYAAGRRPHSVPRDPFPRRCADLPRAGRRWAGRVADAGGRVLCPRRPDPLPEPSLRSDRLRHERALGQRSPTGRPAATSGSTAPISRA